MSLDIGLFAIHIVHSLGCSYRCWLNGPFSLPGQTPREVKQEQELGIVVKAKEVQCWHSGIMTDYMNVYVHEFEA